MIAKQEPEMGQFSAVSEMSASMTLADAGAPPAYETWDACDLYDRAQEMLVEGYAFLTKTELVKALRAL